MLLTDMPDIKQELLEKIQKLGLVTVQDVLFYFPRTYEDRRKFTLLDQFEGEEPCCVYGEITHTEWHTTRNKKKFFEVILTDQSGSRIALQWYFASTRLAHFITNHTHIMAFGEPKFRKYMPVMLNPEWSPFATPDMPGLHFMKIVPVYGLTDGVRQEEMRTFIYKLFTTHLYTHAYSYLPDGIAEKYHLPDFHESMLEVHFPKCADMNRLLTKSTPSHKRIIFEELFVKSVCTEVGREQSKGDTIPVNPDHILYAENIERLYKNAGFAPTATQVYAVRECITDIGKGLPLRVLINGDVGTGKTTVAFDVASYIHSCGMQTALMVPTEILAKQHYQTAQKFLQGTSLTCDVLIGGMPKKERDLSLQSLAQGKTSLIIGTHALLQDDVMFKKLGLVIVDEQHKFGAIQRTILAKKGADIHIIQMSATPIPRTIQMTLYGDMRVISLQRIPGKAPATTKVYANHQRKQLYAFIRSYVKTDQVYIVYPLVEDSEYVDLTSATTMSEELAKEFHDCTVGLVHGRMKAQEKDEVMAQFKDGTINILVSTTVIEVGVDVHNATIMVIEHAERFGLSQLHQLRGRVGRGKKESFCLLVTHGRLGDIAKRRIEAMLETSDGYKIAEYDLDIRGPGDYFGSEQSGFNSKFAMADLARDVKALEYARNDARALVEGDPTLAAYPLLREQIETMRDTIYV